MRCWLHLRALHLHAPHACILNATHAFVNRSIIELLHPLLRDTHSSAMSSPMDMMRIQAQIRQNATEMGDYFKDLNEWESEISRKDKAIKEGKIKSKPNASGVRTPGFAEMIPSGVPGVKEKLAEQKAAAVRPKNYTQVRFVLFC